MKRQSNNPTIELKRLYPYALSVTVKESGITEFYRAYVNYLEISADIDRSTGKITETHYRIQINESDNLARWTSRPLDYISQKALDKGLTYLRKLAKDMFDRVNLIAPSLESYKAIRQEAANLGQPVHFNKDLTWHDALILATYQPDCFVWAIRESGTHMLIGYDDWSRAVLEGKEYDKNRYYTYTTARGLRQVTRQEAAEFARENLRKHTPLNMVVHTTEALKAYSFA